MTNIPLITLSFNAFPSRSGDADNLPVVSALNGQREFVNGLLDPPLQRHWKGNRKDAQMDGIRLMLRRNPTTMPEEHKPQKKTKSSPLTTSMHWWSYRWHGFEDRTNDGIV